PLARAALRPGVNGVVGLLPGSFTEAWRGDARTSCLTGNAQIAFALFQLGTLVGDPELTRAADAIVDATKRTQRLHARSPGVRGGVAGSHPFASGYLSAHYPNWAAKFFGDALLFRVRRSRGA